MDPDLTREHVQHEGDLGIQDGQLMPAQDSLASFLDCRLAAAARTGVRRYAAIIVASELLAKVFCIVVYGADIWDRSPTSAPGVLCSPG